MWFIRRNMENIVTGNTMPQEETVERATEAVITNGVKIMLKEYPEATMIIAGLGLFGMGTLLLIQGRRINQIQS